MAEWGRPSNHRRKNNSRQITLISHMKTYTYPGIYLCAIFLCWFSVDSSELCPQCDQGRCIDGFCICYQGWKGSNCDECYGRVRLQPGKQGIIYDGIANYSKDMTCSWLLDAERYNMTVRFAVNEFATECIWDHLYLLDGDSAFAPPVSVFSGIIWNSGGKPTFKFKLNGRYMFIHFYSDAAKTMSGFNISYFIDDCALDCSNAVCVNGSCVCNPGWTGQNCETPLTGCLYNCSNHGSCSRNQCQCLKNYLGDYCSARKGDLLIEDAQESHPQMTGRASFSLTLDDSDGLWVLGGYMFSPASLSNNMFRYIIKDRLWTIPNETQMTPWPCYGHSTVFYKNSLYLYGGVHKNAVVKDLWKYDISNQTWTKLATGPRNISGHTAHVVNNVMIIIFGYSPDYGYSNKILEYDFASAKWTVAKTSGSLVLGTYGHTSVYDDDRKKVYVCGGYQLQSSSSNQHTDQLYQYDPFAREWYILQGSGSARYLHSAAMINGLMLVFGGNIYSEIRPSKQPECFSSDFVIYDRDSNTWYNVSSSYLNVSVGGLDRFGHKSVSANNVVYIFGGFSSVLKSDLLIIKEGDCSFYTEEAACNSAVPGVRCQWKNNQCHNNTHTNSVDVLCSGYNTCESCQNATALDCLWCGSTCNDSSSKQNCNKGHCTVNDNDICGLYHMCKSCEEEEECTWHGAGKCGSDFKEPNKTVEECSQKTCSEQHSCEDCTGMNCMWCGNMAQCIDTSAYMVSFNYGQCTYWTTIQSSCQANNCSKLATCADCQANPKCGWCNDQSGTGTGICLDGGMSGPIRLEDDNLKTQQMDLCSADRWFFNDCPKCQCNGHSTCFNGSDICKNCSFPTTGPNCQFCSDGFYGSPVNGANCTPCFCNGQADKCNNMSGDCYCRTRGVIGKFCDKCDENSKYSGDPTNGGTCYYQLNTDYQYTFNLSKPEENYLTQINFFNTPISSDRDLDFTLNCSKAALINITYKSRSFPEEKEFVSNRPCEFMRTRFEYKNHAFAGKENTTFYVYVYSFRTPLLIQISFVQPDKINLLRFFIIFFSCFLSLLLIAAALWKIKHKYDTYRRRQQMIVEMKQMASRPFANIAVEIDRKTEPAVQERKDHLDTLLRRRKKISNKPSAVAVEPLVDQKAAILTLLIQLPSGDLEYTPTGQCGVALGSALVSIGSNRKQSLEHAKGDRAKNRKTVNHTQDTCA